VYDKGRLEPSRRGQQAWDGGNMEGQGGSARMWGLVCTEARPEQWDMHTKL